MKFISKENSQNTAQMLYVQLLVDLVTPRKCCSYLYFRPLVPMQRVSVQQTFQAYRGNHARLDPIDPISTADEKGVFFCQCQKNDKCQRQQMLHLLD